MSSMKALCLGLGLFLCCLLLQAQTSSVTRRTVQTARPEGFDQTFTQGQPVPPQSQIIAVRQPSEAEKTALMERTILSQKKRAEEGSVISQYDLGVRYLEGDGVHQNKQKALHWLRRSAAGNYTPAKNKLAKLGESENPVEKEPSRAVSETGR